MGILMRAKSSVYGLNSDLAALQAADALEASTRSDADALLTANLAAEVAARTAAIATKAQEIAAEASARAAADAQLASDLADEVSTRTSEDAAINTRIGNLEQTVATGSSIRGAFNTLTGLATLNESELLDGYMYGIRDTNDVYVYATGLSEYDYQPAGWTGGFIQFVNVADVTNAINTEADARTAADNTLQSNITAEATARSSADAALQASLDQEIADRVAAIAQEVVDRNEAIRLGGAINKLETRVVASGKINLSFAPKNGINGIMNFGYVRYTDGNGVSFDAPLTAGSTTTEFLVGTDTAGQWDGNTVVVQYQYIQPV